MSTSMVEPGVLKVETGNSSKAERLIRRVAFFRKIGLFGRQDVRFEVSRAVSLEDLWEAYHLVHDCYVARGYIEPDPNGVRVRPFEAMPEMATFVAKVEGRVVAVTSVLMDSPELGLPSDKAFGAEIRALRADGRRVCEITNLAVHPDYRNTGVFSELTRCCFAHALAIGYDDLFIAISPEHGRFFQEVLLFEPWGGRRSYSTEVEDIVVGMRLELRGIERRAIETDGSLAHEAFLHDFYFAKNPFHGCVRRWAVRAAGILRDIPLLRGLYVRRSNLLRRLSAVENAVIRSRWGDDIFHEVISGEGDWQPEPGVPAVQELAAA